MSDCGKEIVTWQKNYFRRTMNINEPRGPKYHCTQCDEMLHTRLSMFTHSKMHLKPYCIVCGLYTQDVDQMQNHMKHIHRELIDINGNPSETNGDAPNKLKGLPAKKTPNSNASNRQIKGKSQHLVSRFGRCINVKTPADF